MTTVKPRELPDVRRKVLRWLREFGQRYWQTGHENGTTYYIPPDLRNLTTKDAFAKMIEREIANLADSKLFAVTDEMTFLAAKTGMPHCHVPFDILPAERGLIAWAKPIGVAEEYRPPVLTHDGEIMGMVLDEWYMQMDQSGVIPVIAASWEVQADSVFVWFHTHRKDLARKNRWSGEEYEQFAQYAAPLLFEREQIIPLDREIGWFTSSDEDRLHLTAGAAMDDSAPDWKKDRDREAEPQVEQMTKALVATWHLMHSKMVDREPVKSEGKVRKAEHRDGVTPAAISAGVQVIKLGRPLRTQKPKSDGDPAFRWKKRRIVGPFVRQHYYPGDGTHKPLLIEPYIAGPEGAPIGNAEKVYLLG